MSGNADHNFSLALNEFKIGITMVFAWEAFFMVETASCNEYPLTHTKITSNLPNSSLSSYALTLFNFISPFRDE